MYPRNAASPPTVAVGSIYLIADGTIQTSGASARVKTAGGAWGAAAGSLAYDATSGCIEYTPTQAETNGEWFMVAVYKASCTSASITVVTSESATAGRMGAAVKEWNDVALGTTNPLPNAAPDAAGGLPVSDAGGLDLDTLLSRLTGDVATAAKLLAYVQLLARSDAAIATDNATELDEINADGGSGAGNFSNQADSEEALRDRVDAIRVVSDKLDDTLEDDSGTYRFTENSLEQAPGGSRNITIDGTNIVIQD